MPSVGISPHDICNERVFRSLAGFGKPKGLVHDPCLVTVKSQKFVTWGFFFHDYESMNWTEAFLSMPHKNNQILDLKKLQFISNLLIKRKVNPGAGGYKPYDLLATTLPPRTLAASLAHLLWSPQNMWGDDGRCGCVSEIWSRSEVVQWHMYYSRLKLCIWSLGMVNANWSEFKNVACLERRIITLDWKSVLHKWCHAINCSIQDV